uniref:Uncharacterized protein n=1 Tax=Plectus sambesii TaxID=2011161 RepID=A0A914VNX6_9BILA
DGAQEDHYQLVNGVISIKVSDGQQAGGEHARRPGTIASRADSAATDISGLENSEYHSCEDVPQTSIPETPEAIVAGGRPKSTATEPVAAGRPKTTASAARPQRPPTRPRSRHTVEPSTSNSDISATGARRTTTASASGKRDTILAPSSTAAAAAVQNGTAGAA